MRRVLHLMVLCLGGWLMLLPGDRAQPQDKQSEFASDRAPEPTEPVEIDGERVLGYLKQICDLGPRMSGTRSMRLQQELLKAHFTKHGGKVQLQTFEARQLSQAEPVEMSNLIVRWHPERERRVILCSHYDTRPIADQERDPRKWREPFVSANDGGSGVALLMELAHFMGRLKTQVGVDFVCFDGEEYIFEPKKDQYFIGSKHFAQTWRKTQARPTYLAALLFDMIGGANARFPAEGYSAVRARPLVEQIWGIAAEQRCGAFLNRVGQHVQDDHLALLNAGIPAIDIIDFDYPHWHKLSDTPANCSDEGMRQVARVVSVWLQRIR